MIKVGDLIQETGKPVVICTGILDERDLTWMSLDGKSAACDAIFFFKKLEKEELQLTPEETIGIICHNDKLPYKLIHLHESHVYYGDMTTEYNFDVIFEEKETKKQFVIKDVLITEGSTRWFEDYDLEDDFLDDCDRHNITSFLAMLCVYNSNPPYTIVN